MDLRCCEVRCQPVIAGRDHVAEAHLDREIALRDRVEAGDQSPFGLGASVLEGDVLERDRNDARGRAAFALLGIGVLPDQLPGRIDLEIDEAECVLLAIRRAHHLMPEPAGPHVHLTDRVGEADAAPPAREMLGLGHRFPDQCAWRIEDPAHDDHGLLDDDGGCCTHRCFLFYERLTERVRCGSSLLVRTFPPHRLQIFGEIVEAAIPEAPIAIEPVGHRLQRRRLQMTGTPLCFAPARDQPRAFEHLQMLGNGGEAHVIGLGQLGDRGIPRGKAGQDAAARRVGEGEQRRAELVGRHSAYSTYGLITSRLNTVRTRPRQVGAWKTVIWLQPAARRSAHVA